jgi:predicted permease
MLDWSQYVRENLHLQNVRPEREAEIIEDLGQQLADAYNDALSRGLNQNEAGAFARDQITNWRDLARSVQQSRAGTMDTLDKLQWRMESRPLGRRASSWIPIAFDLIFALRMMRKNPVFTAVAVLTLALGIGANTAIFSALNSLLFQARPAENPQALVSLRWNANSRPKIARHSSYGDCQTRWSASSASSCSFSLPFFRSLQQQPISAFAGLAGFAGAPRLDLSGNGSASIVTGQLVSGDYFSTLGVHAAAGRLISAADDIPHSSNVVVLSYRYWRSAFDGSVSAIGRTVRINSVPFTIIGVAEPRFTNLAVSNAQDVWLPLSANPELVFNYDPRQADADSWWVEIVARLRDDASRKRAESEVASRYRNEVIYGEKPVVKESDQPSVKLVPVWQALGPSADKLQPVYVLAVAVGLLLLIACVNVGGLLLARATARRKEITVRVAMGASRSQILRQLLTESVLLSALGGSCGVLFSIWALRAIMDMVSNGGTQPLPFSPAIDLRVLAFTGAVSVLMGVVFGIAPALRAARVDLNSAMKQNGDGAAAGGARRRFSLGNVLVSVQVGLAIVLLVGAGMFARTLSNLEGLNPGFDVHNVLLFGIDGRLAGYKDAEVDDLYLDLRQRLSAIAGVARVSYSWRPLLRGSLWTHDLHLNGAPADARVETDYLAVGPSFFNTMGIPLLSGHDFSESEFASARTIGLQVVQHPHDTPPRQPMPAIINQKFAEQYLKGTAVIGQQFGYEDGAEEKSFGYEVVGIVSDAKYNALRREIKPTLYVPSAIAPVYFEVRTALNPESLIPTVRNTISAVDSSLPLFDIKTQVQQIEEQLVIERTLAKLSVFFGMLALLLASIGLYGLMAFEVNQRTREVGVRMALGARQSDVVAVVLRRGILLAALGALGGIPLAMGLVRLLSTLLYGVGPLDPATLAGVSGMLFAVVLAACLAPAWRAATVDPVISIRCE